jgi:hypothetical protein
MKKISKIFLISLTLLTFSNTASAGFFDDIFDFFGIDKNPPSTIKRGDVNYIRCKVEYTQLDLSTGLEKTVKHTVQYDTYDIPSKGDTLHLSAQDLTDKINIWLNESKRNVITDLTVINCKEKRLYLHKIFIWKSEYRWSKYKSCPDEFNIQLMDWLEYPKQWGYNVNKDRLIKDYEEGCKNHFSQFKDLSDEDLSDED